MREKPWAAAGLSPDERARLIYRSTKIFSGAIMSIAEAIEAAVRDAMADAGPKWISTKDAMPIVGNNVLALWSQSETCERIYERCYVDEWGFWRYSRTGEQIWNNSVSHWQYVTVPEPPKEHQ